MSPRRFTIVLVWQDSSVKEVHIGLLLCNAPHRFQIAGLDPMVIVNEGSRRCCGKWKRFIKSVAFAWIGVNYPAKGQSTTVLMGRAEMGFEDSTFFVRARGGDNGSVMQGLLQ